MPARPLEALREAHEPQAVGQLRPLGKEPSTVGSGEPSGHAFTMRHRVRSGNGSGTRRPLLVCRNPLGSAQTAQELPNLSVRQAYPLGERTTTEARIRVVKA